MLIFSALIVALRLSLRAEASSGYCQLEELTHRSTPTMMATFDSRILVNVSTYLDLLDEPVGFLSLQPESVSISTDMKHSTLSLHYDCARIDLMLVFTPETFTIKQVSLTSANVGPDHEIIVCENGGYRYDIPTNQRLSCLDTLVAGCYVKAYDASGLDSYHKPVAQIVFDTLEIEVRDRTELLDIDPNQFIKNPNPESCRELAREIIKPSS